MDKKTQNLFDDIINRRRKNLFIFTFGATGAGKSSMLTYIFKELKDRYGIYENLDDGSSTRLLNDYIQGFELYNELPEGTGNLASLVGTPFQYIDIALDSPKHRIENTTLTFLEFSGEDIETIDREYSSRLDKYKERKARNASRVSSIPRQEPKRASGIGFKTGKKIEPEVPKKSEEKKEPRKPTGGYAPGEAVRFIKQIDDLLTHPDIYVMCFLVASAEYPEVDDYLIKRFLSLIKQKPKYLQRLIGVNLVIAKWDLAGVSDDEIEEFSKKRLSNSYRILKNASEQDLEFDMFPFSVGQLDSSDGLRVDQPEYKYAQDIVDLIEGTIQTKPQQASQSPTSEPVKKPPKPNKGGSFFSKYW